MKRSLCGAAALACSLGLSFTARADVAALKGSDTLFGVVTEAINKSGLAGELSYAGGGSGLGEKGLVAGTQGIAPMSRALSATGIADAAAKQIVLSEVVIGLDGVAVFVKASESPLVIAIEELASIFGGEGGLGTPAACASPTRIVDWSGMKGSNKVGRIQVFRRNDDSGTTDTFKSLVGIKAFCPDVAIRATTADIATETATNPAAIAYAGLGAELALGNRPLAVLPRAVTVPPTTPTVPPTTPTVPPTPPTTPTVPPTTPTVPPTTPTVPPTPPTVPPTPPTTPTTPTVPPTTPSVPPTTPIAVLPTVETIRDFSYPLARRLYVGVASGAVNPSASEAKLLENLLDPSFIDPILVANDFVACPITGCP